jgi:soluble lytic murein transglycosylase-like protein
MHYRNSIIWLLLLAVIDISSTIAVADLYGYKNHQGHVFITGEKIAPPSGYFLYSQYKYPAKRKKPSTCINCKKKRAKKILYQSQYAKPIQKASSQYGIDVALIRAIIHTESAFNPRAISPKGAVGLMQLMPFTAKRFGVTDRFDPSQNIEGGVRYLKWLMSRYKGNTALVLAAYNAGEGAVDKYSGIPPYKETQAYVKKVHKLIPYY